MVLKFVEAKVLVSGDEAEAIATLNDFFSRYSYNTILTTGNVLHWQFTCTSTSTRHCYVRPKLIIILMFLFVVLAKSLFKRTKYLMTNMLK